MGILNCHNLLANKTVYVQTGEAVLKIINYLKEVDIQQNNFYIRI